MVDVLDLHPGDHLIGRMVVKFLSLFDLQLFESAERHLLASRACVEALETEHQCGALMNQQQPPSQQIAHRSQPRIIDVTRGQNL